jgi:hypothetical protein
MDRPLAGVAEGAAGDQYAAGLDRIDSRVNCGKPSRAISCVGGDAPESSVTPRAGLVAVPAGWPDRTYSHTFPTPGTFQGEVDFQKRWFADRVNFIDTNLLDAPAFNTRTRPSFPPARP